MSDLVIHDKSMAINFPEYINFRRKHRPQCYSPSDTRADVIIDHVIMELRWFASPDPLVPFYNMLVKENQYYIPGYKCHECNTVRLVPQVKDEAQLRDMMSHRCMLTKDGLQPGDLVRLKFHPACQYWVGMRGFIKSGDEKGLFNCQLEGGPILIVNGDMVEQLSVV